MVSSSRLCERNRSKAGTAKGPPKDRRRVPFDFCLTKQRTAAWDKVVLAEFTGPPTAPVHIAGQPRPLLDKRGLDPRGEEFLPKMTHVRER